MQPARRGLMALLGMQDGNPADQHWDFEKRVHPASSPESLNEVSESLEKTIQNDIVIPKIFRQLQLHDLMVFEVKM